MVAEAEAVAGVKAAKAAVNTSSSPSVKVSSLLRSVVVVAPNS